MEEVIAILYAMGLAFFTPLTEQYYYNSFGRKLLNKNTSSDFQNGSVCVTSSLLNNLTGSNERTRYFLTT